MTGQRIAALAFAGMAIAAAARGEWAIAVLVMVAGLFLGVFDR
jgi:hypothetical protein